MLNKNYDNWKLQEPPEPKPIATDWLGEDLFEGDLVYKIDNELIHEDEVIDYIKSVYGKPYELKEEYL